eukprot:8738512-Prorocentrum_lima.AAC.1
MPHPGLPGHCLSIREDVVLSAQAVWEDHEVVREIPGQWGIDQASMSDPELPENGNAGDIRCKGRNMAYKG